MQTDRTDDTKENEDIKVGMNRKQQKKGGACKKKMKVRKKKI